ncbi:MAG: hypothetical protein HY760_04375, partial [Nitrospirae bacterium]|nr:hypothetical protein [Nitrospirota bacterium]
HNLAAVKAQVDFIRERAPDAEVEVHPFTGEAGAIGAALEALGISEGGTRFIGLEGVERLSYTTSRDESTRCHFCKNHCLRTFVDLSVTEAAPAKRYIIATCDKGAVERVEDAQEIKKRMDRIRKVYPNFAAIAAKEAFAGLLTSPHTVPPTQGMWERLRIRLSRNQRLFVPSTRTEIRVGIPRVLNLYSVAPFFVGYFQALGIPYRNLIFSDITHEVMYKEGSRRGAIDACFPSKVALAHVHQLLSRIKEKRGKQSDGEPGPAGPDLIFFPLLLNLPTELAHTLDSAACPTVAATPEVGGGDLGPGDLSPPSPIGRPGGPGGPGTGRAARRGPPGKAVSQRPGSEPWDPGGDPETGVSHLYRGIPPRGRRYPATALRGGDRPGRSPSSPGDHRCLEERLQREHQPESVGRQIRRPASESGGPGSVQLQVRPRRPRLFGGRGDPGGHPDPPLHLPRSGREPPRRVDPDPGGDDPLFPSGVRGGPFPEIEPDRAKGGDGPCNRLISNTGRRFGISNDRRNAPSRPRNGRGPPSCSAG